MNRPATATMRTSHEGRGGKTRRERIQQDFIISTNVFADYHRLLQDALDCKLNTPYSDDSNDLREIARHSARLMVEVAADTAAETWRDFNPMPNAWPGAGMQEMRGATLGLMRQDIEEQMGSIKNSIEEDVLFASLGPLRTANLPEDAVRRAVTAGIGKGEDIILGALTELEIDAPGSEFVEADIARERATCICWNLAARRLRKYMPFEPDAARVDTELYATCYLQVAHRALRDMFTLACQGTTDPEAVSPSGPLSFAGAILSEMGLPQLYDDKAAQAEREEVAAKKAEAEAGPDPEMTAGDLICSALTRRMVEDDAGDDECEPSPNPVNGEVAESPVAIQIRELMVVCDAISDSLREGTLQQEAWQLFREEYKNWTPAEADAPEADARRPHVAFNEVMQAMAWGMTADMMDEIKGDMMCALKREDGWAVNKRQLRTPEQRMTVGWVEPVALAPALMRMQ